MAKPQDTQMVKCGTKPAMSMECYMGIMNTMH